MFGRREALGSGTKIQVEPNFMNNITDKGIALGITKHHDCCEHLRTKLQYNTVKGTFEPPRKKSSESLECVSIRWLFC